MGYLINHFKKVLIIFIVVMLLIIPNMRVYSFVGRYETSSQAITANSYYNSLLDSHEKTVCCWPGAVGFGVFAVLAITVIVAGIAIKAIEDDHGGKALLYNSFDENYTKYDFSDFDN